MPSVHGVSHIVLMCKDVQKMKQFYCDVLGFTVAHEGSRGDVFITSDPAREEHEIALFPGRGDGESSVLNHIALHVDTVEQMREFYQVFNEQGVVDRCTSHGNTVSCYFFDPDGNRLEVYALVTTGEYHGPLDLTKSADEILALYTQRRPAGVH